MFNRDVVADVLASRRVTAEHVRILRRSIYADGRVELSEVDRLFTIEEAATAHDPSWSELFCEAVADYIVEEVEPLGHVSEKNAAWLISRISRDGTVKTGAELEALIGVLERAKTSPESLAGFALQQVKKAVIGGEGALASGREPAPCRVGRDDVELIRRILYAFGGSGNAAITRSEAEVLFDINDATAAADNDPAWNDIFVKAIANFLMAASGYVVPPRHEALRREDGLASEPDAAGDLIGQMAAGGLRRIWNAYRHAGVDQASAARNARSAPARAVTADEAEWLAARMGRNGTLHENLKALLRFVRDESSSIHPSLQPLIDRAA
jgi:hypothetical protein